MSHFKGSATTMDDFPAGSKYHDLFKIAEHPPTKGFWDRMRPCWRRFYFNHTKPVGVKIIVWENAAI